MLREDVGDDAIARIYALIRAGENVARAYATLAGRPSASLVGRPFTGRRDLIGPAAHRDHHSVGLGPSVRRRHRRRGASLNAKHTLNGHHGAAVDRRLRECARERPDRHVAMPRHQ